MNKDLFYQKMKPYFDEGLVREIYSSDHVCILSVGDICYVACQYVLIKDEPVGIYANENIINKLVKNNRYIYPLMDELFSDLNAHRGSFYNFPISKLDIYKNWIKNNREKGISAINYQLEEEIAEANKNKAR